MDIITSSNKKVMNHKVTNFLIYTTFVLGASPSEILNYQFTLTYHYGAYGLFWYKLYKVLWYIFRHPNDLKSKKF